MATSAKKASVGRLWSFMKLGAIHLGLALVVLWAGIVVAADKESGAAKSLARPNKSDSGQTASSATSEIKWHRYSEGMEPKTEQRVSQFTAKWCSYCKK
jgi:hypothetical protein